jgi:hypothetical protein
VRASHSVPDAESLFQEDEAFSGAGRGSGEGNAGNYLLRQDREIELLREIPVEAEGVTVSLQILPEPRPPERLA